MGPSRLFKACNAQWHLRCMLQALGSPGGPWALCLFPSRLGWGIVKSRGIAAVIGFVAAAIGFAAAVIGSLAGVTRFSAAVLGVEP